MSAALPPNPRAPHNVTCLLDHFDLLLATPDDVMRLEAAILQLAVQGKLVPQDPDDEPAVVLLERNVAKRKALEENGEIKPLGELPPISPTEIPYDLPENWIWCRLGELTTYGISDKVESGQVELGTWVLDLKDIEKTTSRLLCKERVGEYDFKSTKSRFFRGDVLYGKLRPYLDKVVVADEDGVCTTEIIPLHGYVDIDPYFLRLCLKRPDFIEYANGNTYGMNLPRLNTQDARMALLPLAPLAEQKRIVAKVDALLAQTRALAAGLEQADAALVPAAQAAFQALPDAPDATVQRAAWQRVADHFDALTNDPRAIAALKQTILQLAVEGKLVPQNPEDEPASVLLERIEAEKVKWGAKDETPKLRKQHLKSTKIPYKLPKGWIWCRTNDICQSINDGDHQPPPKAESGIPFLVISNIRTGQLDFSNTRFVPESYYENIKEARKPRRGDILYSIVGSLGIPVMVDTDEKFCFQRHIALFRPMEDINRHFLYYLMMSPLVLKQGRDFATGIAQLTIPMSGLREIIVPLPPVAEQQRIVATVEALLALCDALAAGVVQAEAVRGRVLGAVLNGEAPAANGERINE